MQLIGLRNSLFVPTVWGLLYLRSNPHAARILARLEALVRLVRERYSPDVSQVELDDVPGASGFAELLSAGHEGQRAAAGRLPARGAFELNLERLRVRRFRALVDFELNLPDAVRVQRGLGRLRSRGSEGRLEVEVGFSIDPGVERVAGAYALSFYDPHGRLRVEHERLVTGPAAEEVTWLDGRLGQAVLRRSDGELETRYKHIDELAVRLAPAEGSPIPEHVAGDLASVVLIDRDPVVGQAGRTRHGLPIQHLVEAAARDPARTRRLGEVVTQLVTQVRGVTARALTGEAASLLVEERDAPGLSHLEELPAGTRQMILLAALYVIEQPPRIILLEEPDAGLHPDGLPALRDLLRSLATRSTVVATTHAPALVDLLDAEREVVALERTPERITATSLAAAQASKRWLDSFRSTGDRFVAAAMERSR